MTFNIQVKGLVQRAGNHPSGIKIPSHLYMETVIDCSVIHLRHLERVGTEIPRCDKRLLAQIRLNNGNACKHGVTYQQ